MKKYLTCIIFWGALWGLTEATLGYVLHTLSLGIGWVVWFPLAFCFTGSVYRRTDSLPSVIFTSFLAAAIKLVDFTMPASPDRIINPAVSIILEGFAVCMIFMAYGRRNAYRPGFLGVLSASMVWRALYLAYMLLMPASYAAISPLRSAAALLNFLLVESTVNSLLIFGCMKASKSIGKKIEHGAEKTGGLIKQLKTNGILSIGLQSGLKSGLSSGLSGVLNITLTCLMLAAALFAQWAL
jgi:hypothetical protein